MNSLRNIMLSFQGLMQNSHVEFEDGMHPSQLYMDIKTLELDYDECKAQNSHAKVEKACRGFLFVE